jgi:hypothetical protein
VIQHHSGAEIVRLIKKHRLPGAFDRSRSDVDVRPASTLAFSAEVSVRSMSRIQRLSSMRVL